MSFSIRWSDSTSKELYDRPDFVVFTETACLKPKPYNSTYSGYQRYAIAKGEPSFFSFFTSRCGCAKMYISLEEISETEAHTLLKKRYLKLLLKGEMEPLDQKVNIFADKAKPSVFKQVFQDPSFFKLES